MKYIFFIILLISCSSPTIEHIEEIKENVVIIKEDIKEVKKKIEENPQCKIYSSDLEIIQANINNLEKEIENTKNIYKLETKELKKYRTYFYLFILFLVGYLIFKLRNGK